MSDVTILPGGPEVAPPLINGDGSTVTVADVIGSLISTDLGTDSTILLENQLATAVYPIGTPVYPNANGTHFTSANAAAAATAAVVGLLTKATVVGGPVSYRDRGLLKLTAAQWDALITGESGGLTPGVLYYLSAAAAGKLVTALPTGSSSGVLVGKAITATLMMVSINLVALGSD
jgi:hypothetical protein